MKSLKTIILISVVSSTLFSCGKWNNESTPDTHNFTTDYYSDEVPTGWMTLELNLIRTTPGFTPPVASRALGYTSLTLYESVVNGMPGYKPANKVLGLGYNLPTPETDKTYNWIVVANAAMKTIITNLFGNATSDGRNSIDSMYEKMTDKHKITLNYDEAQRSEAYGQAVAQAIFEWSKTDNGHEGYNNSYPSNYTSPSGPGLWIPTPPAYQPIPLLPYWGNNRPFMAANVTGSCLPPAPYPFSTDTNSSFYKDAYEVYTTKFDLTPQQIHIAKFWSDGGGTFTPPGHLMNIATVFLQTTGDKGASLTKTAEVYLRMGIALSDAFIACWKGKYTYNVIRPVSYINQNIDPEWTPLITTPNFPEYGSGHSTVSGAAAEVLTSMFGDNVEFIDHTNDSPTMDPRGFTSFRQMAEEAALSRLYGGIHYRNSNNNALIAGRQIGQNVVSIRLK